MEHILYTVYSFHTIYNIQYENPDYAVFFMLKTMNGLRSVLYKTGRGEGPSFKNKNSKK